MAIYNPQIGSGTLGSPQGVAERMRDLERMIAKLNGVKTYIGAGSIVGTHIAAAAIVAGHIDAGSINADHIQALSINAGHMQANSITAENAAIANLAVKTANIQDAAILSAKIGDLQVTNAKIGLLAVQTANIDNLAVKTAKIDDLAVQTAKIDDAAILTAKIGDLQVTNAKVANLDGEKINAGTLTADRLVATSASADTLLSRLIHAGSLVATTGLSAVSANMGTLTSGKIIVGSAEAAKTAIGSSISTSSGIKSGIVGTDASNNITFFLDNTTGNLQLKGQILTGSSGLGNLDGKVYNTTDPLFVTNPAGGVSLVADSITTRELFVSTLSAITADMGTLTAGRISGGSIDGNVLDAGTIRTSHLTVGAADGLANGGFEDRAVLSDYTIPASWRKGLIYGTGPNCDSRRLDSLVVPGWKGGYIRSGNAALYLGGASGEACDWASEPIPVTPGDVYTLTFWASQHTNTNGFYAGMWGGAEKTTNAHQVWLADNITVPYLTWTRYSFQWTVPDGVNWAFIEFLSYLTGASVSVDDVSFVKASAGTDIRDGAITTLKLSADAIDGKTITGATIRTAATNPRIELTGGASGALKKYDAGGATPVVLGSTDGLDLLAGDSATPPNDRRIRWMSANDEIMEAYSYLTSLAAGWLKTEGTASVQNAQMTLWARRGGTSQDAQLILDSTGAGVSKVSAYAGGQTRTILRNDSYSDFLQTTSQPGLRVIRGEVSAAGGQAVPPTGSGGWSSAITGTGLYTVTFSESFVDTPIVVATPVDSSANNGPTAHVYARSSTSFSVKTSRGGAAVSLAFDFIVIGPMV